MIKHILLVEEVSRCRDHHLLHEEDALHSVRILDDLIGLWVELLLEQGAEVGNQSLVHLLTLEENLLDRK